MRRILAFATAFVVLWSYQSAAYALDPPSCAVAAQPLTATAGQNVTLTWTSQNATAASIASVGAIAVSGSQTVVVPASPTAPQYTVTVSGPGGKSDCSVSLIDRTKYIWFMRNATVSYYRSQDPSLMAEFDSPNLIYRSSQRKLYGSFAELQSDIDSGKRPTAAFLIYDPEPWDMTPIVEQRNPLEYAQKFADLAHKNGYTAVYAPSCALLSGINLRTAAGFITCAKNLWAPAVPYYDVIDMQLQRLQPAPDRYERAASKAAQIIKMANPKVKVLAQVSTIAGNRYKSTTATQMHEDLMRVRNDVDGFYLSHGGGEHGGETEGEKGLAFMRNARSHLIHMSRPH